MARDFGPAHAVPDVDPASLEPRATRGRAGKRTRTEGGGGGASAAGGAAQEGQGAAAREPHGKEGEGGGIDDWAMDGGMLAAMGLGGEGDGERGAGASVGQAMPGDVQKKMEASFGADLSSVRIHEGGKAAGLGARAFAQGDDVHFAPGQYQPNSAGGQEVLGHELAHVVQQRQGKVSAPQHEGGGVNEDAGLEREADEMGARAARGEPAGGAATGAIPERAPSANAPRQLLRFLDADNVEYDPEQYSQAELQQICADLRNRMPTNTSHLAYVPFQNRVAVLNDFIGKMQNAHPTKGYFRLNFESKHVIHSNAINDQTIKESIQKSIDWGRDKSSTMHLSPEEEAGVQRAAMQELAQQGYPQDVMVPFHVQVGWVSQYNAQLLIPGISGDFNIFKNCPLELGVTYWSGTGRAEIMHMEWHSMWPPEGSYHYFPTKVSGYYWGQLAPSYNIA